MNEIINKIDASDQTLRQLLEKQKYTIDYFQREYRWEKQHIEQLISDLTENFFYSFEEHHQPENVANYHPYYMGAVVLHLQNGLFSIIDGQQRLTSFTLLLIYIHHLLKNVDTEEEVKDMISSYQFKRSFNLQVPERERCMEGLFRDGTYTLTDDDKESVQNMNDRYSDIDELFPSELKGNVLPFFVSWLKEKLIFVKITAYSVQNAYTIFETMNDRGLKLTPTEMLKGYLLTNVSDNQKRTEYNKRWKDRILELHSFDKNLDLEFCRAWLRGKHAQTIRQAKVGAKNEDFEIIGTTFHKWVRDNTAKVGLVENNSNTYEKFLEEFFFFSKVFIMIMQARQRQIEGLEFIYYNAQYSVAESLSFPLYLAVVSESENEELIKKKINLVAQYIECVVVRRVVNYSSVVHTVLRYNFYNLIKIIRNSSFDYLLDVIIQESKLLPTFEKVLEYRLWQKNRKFIKFLLARMTVYLENGSGINTTIDTYLKEPNGKPFEIEHIWADKYERHKEEFEQRDDFNTKRNALGGLILLQRGPNQSFNDEPYEIKLPYYLRMNLLAQSLHSDCYNRNPNFTSFINKNNLPFQPHLTFKRNDLELRNKLYKKICELIWSF